jgi:hypothetical protein
MRPGQPPGGMDTDRTPEMFTPLPVAGENNKPELMPDRRYELPVGNGGVVVGEMYEMDAR